MSLGVSFEIRNRVFLLKHYLDNEDNVYNVFSQTCVNK